MRNRRNKPGHEDPAAFNHVTGSDLPPENLDDPAADGILAARHDARVARQEAQGKADLRKAALTYLSAFALEDSGAQDEILERAGCPRDLPYARDLLRNVLADLWNEARGVK